MDTFATRLKKALAIRNIKQSELCEKTGIPKSAMSQYVNGSFEPKQDRLQILAIALNVNEAWLMGYDNVAMEKSNGALPFSNIPGVMPVPSGKKIPIIGTIACGTPVLATENIEEYIETSPDDKATFALRCKGDSMSPRLMDGDIVLIHQQPTVENGETAAVLIGEEATLKRVYIRENSITLAPENLNYEPIHFTGEDMNNVIILGKVVGYTRYF